MCNARAGFTLAEVLLTLVIVGIVAALTIPALLQESQKSQWIAGLKEAISILNQAEKQILMDEGTSDAVGIFGANDTSALNKLATRVNFSKICPNGDSTASCFHTGATTTFDKTPIKLLNGSNFVWHVRYSSAVLPNGMSLQVRNVSSSCTHNHFTKDGNPEGCVIVYFDVNGAASPNTFGRDIYEIALTRYNGALPVGLPFAGGYAHCNPAVTGDDINGTDCGGRIMSLGWQMNY